MPSYTSRTITVANTRLQYLEVEPAHPSSGPPLLLLHQLLATAETLTELIERLPTDRRIVALDLLSAESLSGPLDMRSHSLALLVAQFAESVDLLEPIVIGHSHGGALALWLATMPQVGVRGLVLLSPAHPFAGYRAHVVAFYLTRWGRFLALRIPLAPSRMILWAYNQAAGTGRITLDHLKPHLRVLRNRSSLKRVLEILRTWESDMTEQRNTLNQTPILQPTLLLWGDHDYVAPIESATALKEHLQSWQQVTLPGVGHLLPEEAPDECASLITTWLSGLNPEETAPPGNPPNPQ
ncbi:alpha/beta hydrolase [Granulicella sp. 5B5]|uniref:alpha/beta fold hydrolase n=1 Tax=Granulicella sp. 5B5 TaxID=1617967 RepID=UPI0015F43AF2|nr:alpha/beta hydrolase [Granulicella sp. 5B5]